MICAKAKDKLGCEKYVESLSRPKLIDSGLNEDAIIASLKSIGVLIKINLINFCWAPFGSFNVFGESSTDLPNADLRLDDGFLKGCRC